MQTSCVPGTSGSTNSLRGVTDRRGGPVVFAIAAVAGLAGSLGVIGADALWLVPLGSQVAHGHVPGSILFATAPTGGWHDVPAAAELLFWGAWHALGGERGLVVWQSLAAAAGFGALAFGLRRQGSSGSVALVSAIVLAGSLPAVVVTGVSLYSLAFFPLLLALLESDSGDPGRRIWLAVPLVAVWGNLHGAVIVGLALLAVYLVFSRGRRDPLLSAGVLAASLVAWCLTPVLWSTPSYYRGVLENEAARRGEGLWAPLGLGGFGLLLIGAAVVLGLLAWRHVALWEAVALVGLAAATVHVARNGTWLLLVAAYPAVRGLRVGELPRVVLVSTGLVCSATALVLLAYGPRDPASARMAALAARTGRPVLAQAILGQQVALAGGRVWASNPIDAFRRSDQRLYLNWLQGRPGGDAALANVAYVLVDPSSAVGRRAALDPRLRFVSGTARAALYAVWGS
jgi:hypothetical protein